MNSLFKDLQTPTDLMLERFLPLSKQSIDTMTAAFNSDIKRSLTESASSELHLDDERKFRSQSTPLQLSNSFYTDLANIFTQNSSRPSVTNA